jgi:hypothetical protein
MDTKQYSITQSELEATKAELNREGFNHSGTICYKDGRGDCHTYSQDSYSFTEPKTAEVWVKPTPQTSTQYTVEPSASPEVWAGIVRCIAVYPDRPACLADYDALLAIRNNGKVEVVSRHAAFTVASISFTKYSAILSGYVPVVLGEDERGEVAIGWRYTQVGVSRRAWTTASLFAADVIDGRALAGVQPTPPEPAPPLVDLWSDIPFSVVV